MSAKRIFTISFRQKNIGSTNTPDIFLLNLLRCLIITQNIGNRYPVFDLFITDGNA